MKHILGLGLLFLVFFLLTGCQESDLKVPDQDLNLPAPPEPEPATSLPAETPEPLDPETWTLLLVDQASYQNMYQNLSESEEVFQGILEFQECPEISTIMRCTSYKLGDWDVYAGSEDLSPFVGRQVEIVGKKHSFALEGEEVREIWPRGIQLVE